LFGEDAFYDTLDDVLNAYREQSRAAAPERWTPPSRAFSCSACDGAPARRPASRLRAGFPSAVPSVRFRWFS